MKKIFVALAAAILSAGIAFADDAGERSIHWFGFNIPVESQPWSRTEDDYDYDFDADFVGFNIFYNHNTVGDNRFSKIIDCQIGYSSGDGYGSADFGGLDTRFMFGLGFAPLNIERVVLSVNGTFGVDLKFLTAEESAYYYDYDYTLFGLSTFIGANVQCAFNFGSSFGLSAGMHMYTSLFGVGVSTWDRTATYSSSKYTDDDDGDVWLIGPGGFNIDLKFGVVLMY